MSETLPLNDLDSFYKSFIKRDKLTREDLDARITLPPITKFFRIHRTEYAIRVVGQELPPNRYNFYFLSIVRTGSATKTDGLNTYQIRPHTLWSTPMGQIHSAKDWTADATGYYLSFSPDFIESEPTLLRLVAQSAFFQFNTPHHIYLSEAESDLIYAIFQKIEAEFSLNDEASDDLIRLYITEILLLAERFRTHTHAETGTSLTVTQTLTDKFKSLVEKYFIKEKGIPFYADELAVHPNYLSNVIKAETGMTAGDLIRERIVQEAKYLLYQSNFSVKEVAYYLQFEDASNFSKFFKKHTSLSPQEYQAKYQSLKNT
ncbi:MAG: helix-turn-helix domain-containing protein [Thermoflexibacter sp.]|jgi:AraC-like DNA-binding protein|nr:helix-turn-helix domain-containing protein [Thermoflexibacter sp.]